jgi:LacI family transcriptional regulator
MDNLMKNPPCKIADIAKNLGVSRTTVSYVLNDKWEKRGISKVTAHKILNYIKKVGFMPNPASLALKGKNVKEIAIMVPPDALEHQKRAFFSLLNLLESKKKSYMILPLTEEQLTENAHFIQMYRIRNVIAVTTPIKWDIETQWSQLFRNYSSVDCLFYDFPFEKMMTKKLLSSERSIATGINRSKALLTMIEYIISRGYRNIALPSWIRNKLMELEFSGINTSGINFIDYRIDYVPDPRFEQGRLIAEQLPAIRQKTKGPLAVYINDDLDSAAAMDVLVEKGFAIPKDFAILSWDGLPESKYFIKPLSTCIIPHQKMLDIAIKWLDKNCILPKESIFDIKIREGKTLPIVT